MKLLRMHKDTTKTNPELSEREQAKSQSEDIGISAMRHGMQREGERADRIGESGATGAPRRRGRRPKTCSSQGSTYLTGTNTCRRQRVEEVNIRSGSFWVKPALASRLKLEPLPSPNKTRKWCPKLLACRRMPGSGHRGSQSAPQRRFQAAHLPVKRGFQALASPLSPACFGAPGQCAEAPHL